MYIFWFVLGGLAIVLFGGLEMTIALNVMRQIGAKERQTLPGRKWHYVTTSSISSFVIVSSFYFGLSNYAEVPNSNLCWLTLSIIVALLMGVVTSQMLRNASFD